MPTRIEFHRLAVLRLEEASVLLARNYPDGAFYLAGYAVECALKAAICRTLDIDDFFDTYSSKTHSAKVKDDIVQKFKTHDFGTLLVLSGLYFKLESDLLGDDRLKYSWSTIRAQAWSEQHRYERTGQKTVAAVTNFINSVRYLLQWIKHYW